MAEFSFKIGIFVACKAGERLLKWLPQRFNTHNDAEKAVDAHNKNLKVSLDNIKPGDKFAMCEDA